MTEEPTVAVRRIEADDVAAVLAAGGLFDDEPSADRTAAFLARPDHHLLLAYVDGVPVGFVSGIEIGHPDKAPEMLLYELGVDAAHRRRGIGRSLVTALLAQARKRHCRGMWVPIEPRNEAAVATYRSAGAGAPQDAQIMEWIPA